MKTIILLCLMSSFLMQNPATTSTPPIAVSAKYQTQFQALMVQQKDLQLAQKELVEKYKQTVDQLQKIKQDGLELQGKVLKDMNLDPEKYVVQGHKEGYVEIVEKPKEKK